MASTKIQIYRTVEPVRQLRTSLRKADLSLGFVPTMGALHAGHLSLVSQAAAENDAVIVSIYVNPTQFGVNEDLESYPKTWDSDIVQLDALNTKLREQGARGIVEAVFAPTTRVMYPALPPTSEIDGEGSFVTISPLGHMLEGASRPVFFRGVATVCMKLFNIVAPDRVYFGQKDVQQTLVIKRLVKDFHLDIEVKVGPTLREANGLAMSSRNVYLGERRFETGTLLHTALSLAEAEVHRGGRNRVDILRAANDVFMMETSRQRGLPRTERVSFEVDYISVADSESMEEIDFVDQSRGAIISGAIKMLPIEEPGRGENHVLGGGAVPVRLIDNIIIPPHGP